MQHKVRNLMSNRKPPPHCGMIAIDIICGAAGPPACGIPDDRVRNTVDDLKAKLFRNRNHFDLLT